jgi:hypothetical protein
LLAQSKPDLTTATNLLKGLVVGNVVEQNLQDVYAITIANRISDTLTATQITKLKAIAQQCPYEGGYGVYNARVLLSTVDSKVYMNECEKVKPNTGGKIRGIEDDNQSLSSIEGIQVYPNPANDKLNIAIHLEEGQNATIVVYDLTGKLILSNSLNVNNGLTEVSNVALAPGLYIYKININNTTVNSGKLSIIR